MKQIAVNLDQETYDRLVALAKRDKRSVGAMARIVIEFILPRFEQVASITDMGLDEVASRFPTSREKKKK